MTHGDNVTFVARLSRRLRDGELRGKVYKLDPNATEVRDTEVDPALCPGGPTTVSDLEGWEWTGQGKGW